MRTTLKARVVLFNGPPRVGKDTAARVMDIHWRAHKLPIARAIKETTHRFFGIRAGFGAFEATKDTPCKFFNGLTPRQAYIWMSTVAKEKFGNDYWAHAWITMYEQAMKHRLIPCAVSDAGFQREIATIAQHVGIQNCLLIRLISPGKTFENDSREFVTPLEGMRFVTIQNNYTADFATEVVNVLKTFL